jgi:hypothetical protein
MASYRVTVLRHMNIEMTVEAPDEDSAMSRAEAYVGSASQDTWGRAVREGETWADVSDVESVQAAREAIDCTPLPFPHPIPPSEGHLELREVRTV